MKSCESRKHVAHNYSDMDIITQYIYTYHKHGIDGNHGTNDNHNTPRLLIVRSIYTEKYRCLIHDSQKSIVLGRGFLGDTER